MKILGIDPGLHKTGYAVIEKENNKADLITNGLIVTPNRSLSEKLLAIYEKIVELIDCYKPSSLAVESGFYSKNIDSLIKMSEVKGVIILAAGIKKIDVFEYPPATIKTAVVGKGNATKQQEKYMIEQILKIEIEKEFDISDAIAVALCHSQRI